MVVNKKPANYSLIMFVAIIHIFDFHNSSNHEHNMSQNGPHLVQPAMKDKTFIIKKKHNFFLS